MTVHLNPLQLALDVSGEAFDDQPLLFLACPYSHPEHSVRTERFQYASQASALLMGMGYAVFSPISHGHIICEYDRSGRIGTDAPAWTGVNDAVLPVCNALVVLGLPGCIESAGVRREVALAVRFGLPVNLFHFSEGSAPVVERDVDPTLWADDHEDGGGRP